MWDILVTKDPDERNGEGGEKSEDACNDWIGRVDI